MNASPHPLAVSVIVVNYNGRHWLERCLAAIHAQLTGLMKSSSSWTMPRPMAQ